MPITKLETEIGGRTLSIEHGRVAGLADGAVMVRYGDTIVLATVVTSEEPREGLPRMRFSPHVSRIGRCARYSRRTIATTSRLF